MDDGCSQEWQQSRWEAVETLNETGNTSVSNVSVHSVIPLKTSIVITTTSFLILFCVVSLAVNIVIISSACFVRNKILPTLYISLSLAGADTFSLFLYALGLVLFTLLPRGFGVVFNTPCFFLLVETLRMGAILTTIFHLAALAGNHYMGILKPLKYPVYMTRRNVRCVAILLWTIPSALLLIKVFYIENTLGEPCTADFLITKEFRMTFAIPLFTTLGLMMFIYCHIYALVEKRKKTNHIKLCSKPGSVNRRHQRNQSSNSITRSQVNKKAIVTTLMILGSVIFGWVPAFAYFVLFCKDCLFCEYWKLGTLKEHFILVIINFLMISKTATNSYVYACRMKELKLALKGMRKQSLKMAR
ncbi:octopamine receptor beta-2R-like [Macrosteles quadrilineatus]|uniref:octopamine receptor beta-2R-like n=1 Tax=Macrosteles quadrilineatus TaxID=74068 RepID=UPI0023E26E8D|nr:octopamine receptor beta-2R-like [Macrosteles quadrilineatus]